MAFSVHEQAALDRVPSITLKELWKVGMFLPEPFLTNPEFRIFAKAGNAHKDYVIKVDQARDHPVFTNLKQPQVKPVELRYTFQNDHAVAHCPVDHSPTDTLYFYGGKIVGPWGVLNARKPKNPEIMFAETLARLEGSDGRGPSRGKVRERLLKDLENGPFSADLRARTLLKRAAERSGRRRYRLVRPEAKALDPLSTASGLRRYEGVSTTPSDTLVWEAFEAALVRQAAAGGADHAPDREPAPDTLSRAVFEDHPRLDLRTLVQAGYLQPGQRRRGGIDWSGDTPLIDGVRFVVDLTDLYAPHVWLEMMRRGEARYQRLELTLKDQGGRQRWSFVCPKSGAASEVLAYRSGRFASAKAQGLVHRSQVDKPRRERGASAAKA